MKLADIGLYGLGVMGENLALNMERNGFTVAVYNREEEPGVVDAFMAGRGAGKHFLPALTAAEFVGRLARPRKILMMIRAGAPVDETMAALLPLLEAGDILIDGGNSHYADTERRVAVAGEAGVHYVGMGVSGGELGALNGPSLMPGGDQRAWPALRPILTAIAAKSTDGTPCCDWVGPGGAGHFVKMVHNGIEYGDMQLICEIYAVMKGMGLDNEAMGKAFGAWNEGELKSYLVEITRDILLYRDAEGHCPVDYILDAAGQKGTGKWASVAAFDLGVPLTLISEAVFARLLSSQKTERVAAATALGCGIGEDAGLTAEREIWLGRFGDALYAAKIISYAQGFALLRAASEAYGWNLSLGRIASLWREGCIIRSVFLDRITEAYAANGGLQNLMMAPFFVEALRTREANLAVTVAQGALSGTALPGMSSALSYFYGYRTADSPAGLLQAMRDYFGAHTFERTDRPRGEYYHINWTGEGGETLSGSYQV